LQIRHIQLAIQLLGPYEAQKVTETLVAQCGRALVALSHAASHGLSKEQFDELIETARLIRSTVNELLSLRATESASPVVQTAGG